MRGGCARRVCSPSRTLGKWSRSLLAVVRRYCPLSFDGVLPLPLDLRHARARRAGFHRRARVATRSTLNFLAEGVGFEPTVALATAVFKTAAFVHSATPPAGGYRICFAISRRADPGR